MKWWFFCEFFGILEIIQKAQLFLEPKRFQISIFRNIFSKLISKLLSTIFFTSEVDAESPLALRKNSPEYDIMEQKPEYDVKGMW